MRSISLSLRRDSHEGDADKRYGLTMGNLFKMLRRVQPHGIGGTSLNRVALSGFLSAVQEAPCSSDAVRVEARASVQTTKSGRVSGQQTLLTSSASPLMMNVESFFVRENGQEGSTLGVRYNDGTERWVRGFRGSETGGEGETISSEREEEEGSPERGGEAPLGERMPPTDARVVDIDMLSEGEAVSDSSVWLRFSDHMGKVYYCPNQKPLGEESVFRLVDDANPNGRCYLNRPVRNKTPTLCPDQLSFMPTSNANVGLASLMHEGLIFDVAINTPTMRKMHTVIVVDDKERGLRLMPISTLPANTDMRMPRALRFDRVPTAPKNPNWKEIETINPADVVSFRGPWIRSLGVASLDEKGVCKRFKKSEGLLAQKHSLRGQHMVRASAKGATVRVVDPSTLEFEDKSHHIAKVELFDTKYVNSKGRVLRVYRKATHRQTVDSKEGNPSADTSMFDVSFPSFRMVRLEFKQHTKSKQEQDKTYKFECRVNDGENIIVHALAAGEKDPDGRLLVSQSVKTDGTEHIKDILCNLSGTKRGSVRDFDKVKLSPNAQTYENDFMRVRILPDVQTYKNASVVYVPSERVFRLHKSNYTLRDVRRRLPRVRNAPSADLVVDFAKWQDDTKPPYFIQHGDDFFCNTRLHEDEAVDAYLLAHDFHMDIVREKEQDRRISNIDTEGKTQSGSITHLENVVIQRSIDAMPSASPALRGEMSDTTPLAFGHRHERDALATLQTYVQQRMNDGEKEVYKVFSNTEHSFQDSERNRKATPDGFIFKNEQLYAVVEAKSHFSGRALRAIPDIYREQLKLQQQAVAQLVRGKKLELKMCFVSWSTKETVIFPPFGLTETPVPELVRSCTIVRPFVRTHSDVLSNKEIQVAIAPSTVIVNYGDEVSNVDAGRPVVTYNKVLRARRLPSVPISTLADVNSVVDVSGQPISSRRARAIIRQVDECVDSNCLVRFDNGETIRNMGDQVMRTPLRYTEYENTRYYMSKLQSKDSLVSYPGANIAFMVKKNPITAPMITTLVRPNVSKEKTMDLGGAVQFVRVRDQTYERKTFVSQLMSLHSEDQVCDGFFVGFDVEKRLDEYMETARNMHRFGEGKSAWERWWCDVFLLIALQPDNKRISINIEPAMASAACISAGVDALVAFAEMVADSSNPFLASEEMISGVVWRRDDDPRSVNQEEGDPAWERLLCASPDVGKEIVRLNLEDVRSMPVAAPTHIKVRRDDADADVASKGSTVVYKQERVPLHPNDYRLLRGIFNGRLRPRFASKQIEHRVLNELHMRGIPHLEDGH